MAKEVSATEIIDLPRAQAWEKLRDISRAHHYVPGIIDTRIVSDQAEGVGASRYVYRKPDSYLQETVEEWNEGEGFLIRLHKGDKPAAPFKSAWFRYQLDKETRDRTRLTTTMQFELPGGPFGRLLENLLIGFVKKTVADVALSMKLYYERDEPTTGAALKAYKEQH
jgi:hypothetical protein